ncbi:glycosyl hydrolase [Aureococcus anophagefferens]|nr:glycosyl hydrolase [Aureococcus anophagefferens]
MRSRVRAALAGILGLLALAHVSIYRAVRESPPLLAPPLAPSDLEGAGSLGGRREAAARRPGPGGARRAAFAPSGAAVAGARRRPRRCGGATRNASFSVGGRRGAAFDAVGYAPPPDDRAAADPRGDHEPVLRRTASAARRRPRRAPGRVAVSFVTVLGTKGTPGDYAMAVESALRIPDAFRLARVYPHVYLHEPDLPAAHAAHVAARVPHAVFGAMRDLGVDAFMRVDDDVLFLGAVAYDPFQWMYEAGAVYVYGTAVREDHDVTERTFGAWVFEFCAGIDWGWTKVDCGALRDDVFGRMFFNNAAAGADAGPRRAPSAIVMATRTAFWFEAPLERLLWEIDRTGSIYVHRWGDAPIQTAAGRPARFEARVAASDVLGRAAVLGGHGARVAAAATRAALGARGSSALGDWAPWGGADAIGGLGGAETLDVVLRGAGVVCEGGWRVFDAARASSAAAAASGAAPPCAVTRAAAAWPGARERSASETASTWIPAGRAKAVSHALEVAVADACASRVAARLGSSGSAATQRRVASVRWGPAARVGLQGRTAAGAVVRKRLDAYDATGHGGESLFEEGTPLQYSLMVPHDVPGLVALFGGAERLRARLERYFFNSTSDGGPDAPVDLETGYAALDRIAALYTARDDGLPGNDDVGQTSAWFVWASLGLYPVDPCGDHYELSRPLFADVSVDTGAGRTLRIVVRNAGLPYVRAAFWGETRLASTSVPVADVHGGGTLTFVLGLEPGDWTRY